MQELLLKSGLVCYFGVMESILVIYFDKIESLDFVLMSKSWIGKKFELYIIVLGKVLLVWKIREELDYFLEVFMLILYTCNIFIDKKLFLEEL